MENPVHSAPLEGLSKQDMLAFLEERSRQAAKVQQEATELPAKPTDLEERSREVAKVQQEATELPVKPADCEVRKMDHPFRSAPLGGFNKQDVLAFLEEQSKQAAQAQQQLRDQMEEASRQIEALRQEGEELRRRLEEAQWELEELRQGRDSLNAQLEQSGRELAASREETDRVRQELDGVRGERDRLRARLDEVLPDAQAYAQIKERAAGVELDAHRRAQSIQEKAERDAERVRRQLEQWLERMEKEYSAMRGEVEVTVSHAASELDRVRAGLNRITQLVDSQEGALEGISKAYSETAGPKLAAPMPIPEEE